MTATRIMLPDRLEHSRCRRLTEAAAALGSESDAVLDASKVVFAYPFGVTLLASALLRREAAKHTPVSYVPPEDVGAASFLREVGFVDFLGSSEAAVAGTLRLRRLSASALHPGYPREVAALIADYVPGTSDSVAHFVELAIKEVLQNAIEHARSTTDLVALARWYAQERNVRIAIADSGIGFANSLAKNPANRDLADTELIRRAVTVEGTTGRASHRAGGYGLKHLHRICLERSGSVTLSSHTVSARFSSDGSRLQFAKRLSGTVVAVDFRPPVGGTSTVTRDTEEFF